MDHDGRIVASSFLQVCGVLFCGMCWKFTPRPQAAGDGKTDAVRKGLQSHLVIRGAFANGYRALLAKA